MAGMIAGSRLASHRFENGVASGWLWPGRCTATLRLLLLDEATSALDRRSEEAVHRGLAAARGVRTTLTIAHGLLTARTADRILVLQGGVLIEQGRHEELLARRGTYYDLVAGHEQA
jgi:ABC-type multidrug transport system fused ATPase/permease subunit